MVIQSFFNVVKYPLPFLGIMCREYDNGKRYDIKYYHHGFKF